ncbi:MAG: lycopene cyclase domain-containing protein [Chloroflexi bacterium]|jgi:lycopene cyclase domain-containing protein|nr:lycopene cyclase domain-containing protein [Chloroflexota bacterium]
MEGSKGLAMTYFDFLGLYLLIPIGLLMAVAIWDRTRGRDIPAAMRAWSPAAAIFLHVVIALVYTTIWDNYLVATRVWWYDPALVTGLTIAYVPIEEYTFFILQPILAGLWLLFVLRRVKLRSWTVQETWQTWPSATTWAVVAVSALIWLGSVTLLASGWQPGIYVGLELVWAVPPIALQLAFGSDILWRHRRTVALVIIPLTVYLSIADAIAIVSGIWTISPQKSVGLMLGGILPVEEFLFFLLTNTLVTFGITLVLAQASHERIRKLKNRLGDRKRPNLT